MLKEEVLKRAQLIQFQHSDPESQEPETSKPVQPIVSFKWGEK